MRSISFDFGLDIRKPPYSSLRAFYCTPHYRVIPVYLSDKDADTVLKRLQEKKQKGELFTEEDFAQLAIAPLWDTGKFQDFTDLFFAGQLAWPLEFP